MQTALMLEHEGTVNPAVISKVFDDLDKSISDFEKTIDKHFIKFSSLFDRSKKKKTKERKRRKLGSK